MAIFHCILLSFVLILSTAIADETVPDLIRKHGYICEEHFVTTIDGYILALHRIPHGKSESNHVPVSSFFNWDTGKNKERFPVIMQHGFLSSSGSWVLDLPHKVPAYIMADAGYDVWLPNVRGSTYSKNHTHLSPKSKEFWQFSWDEMALSDVPAIIDYILDATNHKQLYYVGHSMGTTIFFGAMSTFPVYNHKIKAMFGLAPVATVRNMKSPLRVLSYLWKSIKNYLERTGRYEFLPKDSELMKWTATFCNLFKVDEYICENFLFLIVGFDKKEFNTTWIPQVEETLLSGTSVYTVVHFAQEYISGKFQFYDFGSKKNRIVYGQDFPPLYDLRKVTAPVYLITAKNDYLADEEDVKFLLRNLPNLQGSLLVPYDKFNHLDFLWATDSETMIYDPILNVMKEL